MSIRPIVRIGEELFASKDIALRQPTRAVTVFDEVVQGVVTDLTDTLFAHKIAVGLAAPQIGSDLRIAVVNASRDKGGATLVMCNPRILRTSGKKDKKSESCMSIPDVGGIVERREKLAVEYQTVDGKLVTLDAEGFLARVISHEVDHLDGVLYLDRMVDPSTVFKVDIFERD